MYECMHCIIVCLDIKYCNIRVYLYILGPVVIQSSGGDVENQSIINEFVFNGTDSKLSLTCTSIYQNEIIELIRLNTFGSAEEEQSYSSYSYNITFINPTDDFMSILRCKSKNTRLYKDVTVIQSM